MAMIALPGPEATVRLGEWLAKNLGDYDFPALFMRGALGSGKTFLTRALVSNLPGGEEAEISSPSFTICNRYPTRPPVLHCDLYRIKGAPPEEEMEILDNGGALLIVEWAEYFPGEDLPTEFLDIRFKIVKDKRVLDIDAHGSRARALLEMLAREWKQQNEGESSPLPGCR